jgi:PTH2 family peptidyl-tRNA hydrolase
MPTPSLHLDAPPPSTLSVVVATALLAGTIGYFIGSGTALGLFSSSSTASSYPRRKTRWPGKPLPKGPKKSWPNSYDVNVHVDSSDEELMKARETALKNEKEVRESEEEEEEDSDEIACSSEEEGGMLQSEFEGYEGEEVKLVLCVRTDLGMGKGERLLLLYYFVR